MNRIFKFCWVIMIGIFFSGEAFSHINLSKEALKAIEGFENERPEACMKAFDSLLEKNEIYLKAVSEYKELDVRIEQAKRKERKTLKAKKKELSKQIFRGDDNLRYKLFDAVNQAKFLCYKPSPILFLEDGFVSACEDDQFRDSHICLDTEGNEKISRPAFELKPDFETLINYVKTQPWTFLQENDPEDGKYTAYFETRQGNVSVRADLFFGGIMSFVAGEEVGEEDTFMYIENSGFFIPGAPKNIFNPQLEFFVRSMGLNFERKDVQFIVVQEVGDGSGNHVLESPFYTFIEGVFTFKISLTDEDWKALKNSKEIQIIALDPEISDEPLVIVSLSSEGLVGSMEYLKESFLKSLNQ